MEHRNAVKMQQQIKKKERGIHWFERQSHWNE